jgi:hypothetical protein
MATFAQIVIARAGESQGVWALDETFTGGSHPKGEHASLISNVIFTVSASDVEDGLLAGAKRVVAVEHAFFKEMNVAIAGRLDSEVPDTEPMQKRVDEMYIDQNGETSIERRTELTIVIWKEVNIARAASVPPQAAVVIRGTTVAQYETRYASLNGKKTAVDVKAGLARAKKSAENTMARQLDLWNKSWYQAWFSEFPEGSEKRAALAGVHTEESSAPPEILLISSLVQVGFSLKANYDQTSGQHATVMELLYKVEGVDVAYRRVKVNKELGNTVGPFLQNQVVKVRTDVGNSRDFSELSPEQTVVIGPAV